MKVIDCRAFDSGVDLTSTQAALIGKVFYSTRAVIVTNGVTYKLFAKQEKRPLSTEPSAYVNLSRPSETYVVDPKVRGALVALRFMLRPPI